MTVSELKAECEKRGLSTEGKKGNLVQRLLDARGPQVAGGENDKDESGKDSGIDEDGRTQE